MATGADIVSTTLPTVIGMGVVSKSTDILFGGRRRGYRSQGKSSQKHGNTITVGNRVYKLHQGERGGRYYVRKGRKIYV